jgi:hypothetical protein
MVAAATLATENNIIMEPQKVMWTNDQDAVPATAHTTKRKTVSRNTATPRIGLTQKVGERQRKGGPTKLT